MKKKMTRTFLTLLLALALTLGLAACSSSSTETTAAETEEAEATETAAETQEETTAAETEDTSSAAEAAETQGNTASEGTEINIAVLAGPTGSGAAWRMEANDAGETTNTYNFTVSSANDDVVAGLTSGEFDIAAVATNVAANLYNKTSGAVQICALNTYGVLYILENGESIGSMADLAGKTIYATGQGANPEYVLEYLLEQNGLTWSTDGSEADVQIEFMDSEMLSTGMASGEYEVCMLPVPAVTSVLMQNADVRAALDLTEEWNNVTDEGQLTMGCIVVRSEFAAENPEAVAAFLEEYASSIEAVQSDVEHAAELCETYGIVAKAAVAAQAIPDCNLCCVTGEEIRTTIEPYYNVLYTANADSIGGALPGDDFYFVAAAE
ncbi:MAG: ABC transporter substrate-binding protein [Lachnospiraceae bacterium]|nr:ABC transporter substrate-binding protein [Lachnospiraceae bacterium]